MNQSVNYTIKLILVGNSGCGKTTFLKRLIDNKFVSTHDVTIGVDFCVYYMRYKDRLIKLQIWDTAGQECFKAITKSYFRNTAGTLLFYDVTEQETFDDIKSWVRMLAEEGIYSDSIVLIGNKSDKSNARRVSSKRGDELSRELGITWKEISCLTNPNDDIKDVLQSFIHKILTDFEAGDPDESRGITLVSPVETQIGVAQNQGKCC